MTTLLVVALIVFMLVAAWFAWRYFDLQKRIKEYVEIIHGQPEQIPSDVRKLEDLSSAIASLRANFDLRLSTLDSENARLATVLEQLTDGVLIADSGGQVQFANPA